MEGSAEADRIGYRFRGGRPLSFVDREQPFGAGSDPSNVVDCGYAYGSVQVPAGSEPIVLHRDAVSGGGYFMLGTVISAENVARRNSAQAAAGSTSVRRESRSENRIGRSDLNLREGT